jgi:HK97 family phage prohead protease
MTRPQHPAVKTCPVTIKTTQASDGTDEGVFEALVSVFDTVDAVGDVVHKGAFVDTLTAWADSGDPLPVIWSHQHDDPDSHIGTVLEAKETDKGLWVQARLDLDEPRARKIYKLLKDRRVKSFSYAYEMDEFADNDHGGFDLTKLTLYEVGPTLIPANAATDLLTIKQPPEPDGERRRVRLDRRTPVKAGRVLSAKNEQALRDAISQISDGVALMKTVLAAVESAGESAAEAEDDGKARPGKPAQTAEPAPTTLDEQPHARHAATTDEPTPAADRPALSDAASLRLRSELAALQAEVRSLTD